MSEDALIPVVDKDDNILCYKPRGGLEPGDIGRITCLWVMNNQNQVLIAQRSFQKKKDPGLWSAAVAGTVEKGETYESNMAKEAAEEIGLCDQTPKFLKTFYYDGARPFFCAIFLSVVNEPITYFKRQEDEVEQLIWIPYPDLIQDLKNNPDKYVPSLPDFLKHVQHLHEGKI